MPEETKEGVTNQNNAVPNAEGGEAKASEEKQPVSFFDGTDEGPSSDPEGATAAPAATEDPASKDVKKADVPEKYEIKLPEGMKLDEELMKEFEPLAKELGLTNEKAQALMNLQVKATQRMVEEQDRANEAQIKKWEEEVKNDPVIGRDNLNETIRLNGIVLKRFGGNNIEPLRKLLRDSGMGFNPLLTKLFRDIGASMAPDTFKTGESKNAQREPATFGEAMGYDYMSKPKGS